MFTPCRPSADIGKSDMRIGVLALQGASQAHQRMLLGMGVAAPAVRRAEDLEGLDGLVLPGGESSTLLHFLAQDDFMPAVAGFVARRPCLGTCAGLILLARQVLPAQASLGLLDVTVRRNAYGRQRESHICHDNGSSWGETALEMVFIRAPRIERCGPAVEILARRGQEPVLVRQGHLLGCAFHPELGRDTRVHQLLVDACRDGAVQGLDEAS